MKTIILFFGYSLMSVFCSAQQKELDSLLNELNHHNDEDTIKLNLLISIAYAYYSLDPDKGLKNADMAIALAKKLNDELKLAGGLSQKGLNYAAKGEYDTSLYYYDAALKIYQQIPSPVNIGKILQRTGIIYSNLSDYPKSLEYQYRSLKVWEQLQDDYGMANVYNSIGVNYMFLTDYPRSLEYFLKAEKLFEKLGKEAMTANPITNIGLIYNRIGNYTQAIEYHKRALAIQNLQGNREGMAGAFGNLATVYNNLDDHKAALFYFNKSLETYEAIGNIPGKARQLLSIGSLYNDLGDYSKAWPYLQKAIPLLMRTGDKTNLGIALDAVGKIYSDAPKKILLQLNLVPGSRYEEALQYKRKSLEIAKKIKDVEMQGMVWENISSIYEKQQLFGKALSAYKRAVQLKDSVLNDSKKTELDRKALQYEFDKKEAQTKSDNDKKQAVALAHMNQQKMVKNATMAGSALLIITGLISFIFYKKRRDAGIQKTEAEFYAQVADTEMKALRAQMNPHFIFNSLNSISDYMIRHDINSASHFLTKFAKLMRLILENSEQREVSLSEDLKALELYMQLENMRLSNGFSYEIKVEETIDQENTMIPPLILQPFVENSIWHGLNGKKSGGKISIRIQKHDAMLHCTVEDNGVGMQKQQEEQQDQFIRQKKSAGMRITKARIDILNKLKNSNGFVELYNWDEGTRAKVILPLELSF